MVSAPLDRLRSLIAHPRATRTWTEPELWELHRLYRHACTALAALDPDERESDRARELRDLLARAHGVLLSDERPSGLPWLVRALRFLLMDSPRAVRAEWRLLLVSLSLFYGLAACAWFGVSRDLDLAYSLLSPAGVEQEIEQLAALEAGEPFRGNFTFGLGESPLTAGWILLHNIGVGILFFASALVPPLYLFMLGSNALMLGTYTAVTGHWGQAGAISSVLWTHGVLELQALCLVGTAGLVLVRAWIRPGPFSRGHALVRESARALELFAPVFPLLVVAGLIEGFVSPHAPLAVRLATAAASALALLSWTWLGGRAAPAPRARLRTTDAPPARP
jgi:uncharacterized membrane protein SpoIIM required for sporulation